MPKDLRMTPATRLIQATVLRLHGNAGARPIDFASDHIVILDQNMCPVAECWPIERDAGEPPKHVLAMAATAPGPKPSTNGERAPTPGEPKGRLTEAQRELLTRLWTDHPKATVDRIGELFEHKAGRTVSAMTVHTYKPPAGKTPA